MREPKRPALRVEQRRRDVANKKEDTEIVFNAIMAGRFMTAMELKRFIILLYIYIHRLSSDWKLRRLFPFISWNDMGKILDSYVEDGKLLKTKRTANPRLLFYSTTNIGNRYIKEKVSEIKEYKP